MKRQNLKSFNNKLNTIIIFKKYWNKLINLEQKLNKLKDSYQKNFTSRQFVNENILKGISANVKLHSECNCPGSW